MVLTLGSQNIFSSIYWRFLKLLALRSCRFSTNIRWQTPRTGNSIRILAESSNVGSRSIMEEFPRECVSCVKESVHVRRCLRARPVFKSSCPFKRPGAFKNTSVALQGVARPSRFRLSLTDPNTLSADLHNFVYTLSSYSRS